MSAQHTPGPWFVARFESTAVVIGSESGPVLYRGFTEADARLIAAAPSLLNLARAARACIAETPPTKARVELVMVLDVVIAQALGEAA